MLTKNVNITQFVSVLLCFLFCSCSGLTKAIQNATLPTTDPELESYFERFVADGESKEHRNLSSSIPKYFTSLGYSAKTGGIVGECRFYDNDYKEIVVDPNFWKIATDTQKEELLLHEAGHCILLRPHITNTDLSGNPSSIMYPTLVSESAYDFAKSTYLLELFADSALFNPLAPEITGSANGTVEALVVETDGNSHCEHFTN